MGMVPTGTTAEAGVRAERTQPPAAGAVPVSSGPEQTVVELRAENEQLRTEAERLRHRIRLLEKMLFGPRSERLVGDDARQGLFEELLREAEQLNAELQKAEAATVATSAPAVPRARPTSRRNLEALIPDNLPEEIVVLDIPEVKKVCPDTATPLVKIGEDRVTKLAYRPGSYIRKIFVTLRYAVPGKPLAGVVAAPAPDFAIPGGSFDESFLAHLAVEKCAMHLPLYRQEERLAAQGIEVSRQTLSRLYIRSAEVLLPLYNLMKRRTLDRGVIFTDDTPVPLLVPGRGKTVTGRMWVYVAGGCGPPFRVFEFTVDRKKVRPMEFLGDYRGYIHADAYNGYDGLFEREGVIECACWMHVRRKFVEAEDGPPEVRQEILRLIRGIYRFERVIRGRAPKTVLAVRRERSAPLIDRIFDLAARALADRLVLPRSAFAGAIGYLQGRGDALRTFLSDPRLRPDNGESERAIRPLAIGRKNWLFAGSKNGGDATGVLLSLIQTCRAMDIDPQEYLEDVLRRINGHPACRLDELLPGNWQKAESYYG
jgi:transposase